MKINAIVIIVICSLSFLVIMVDIDPVDAAKTGSYNFCTQFPAFPECVGWRTEAVTDNYWFCDFVYLEKLCKNPPTSEKTIQMKNQNDCCQYIGSKIENAQTVNKTQDEKVHDTTSLKENLESILPLVIWTDKDHYDFRDKAIVYGKFDFTNPSIFQNIKGVNFAQTGEISENTFSVDIELNGKDILRDIPVSQSGWFSGFFHHNNSYSFSTQSNFVKVEYKISKGQIPLGGPTTQAIYHFTTGDIAKTDETFDIWIDESDLPNKIQFGVITENPERFLEQSRLNLVTTRLTTPEGFVVPIESNYLIKDLSKEYSEFLEYGNGTYEIQVTYGNNVASAVFEY